MKLTYNSYKADLSENKTKTQEHKDAEDVEANGNVHARHQTQFATLLGVR